MQLLRRTRDLLRALKDRPHYIFGRFEIVRSLNSGVAAVRDLLGREPLLIGDLYKGASSPLSIGESGLIRQTAPVDAQIGEMRSQSYSLGPHLSPEAVAAIRDEAAVRPLFPNSQETTCGPLSGLSAEQKAQFAFASVGNASQIPAIRAIAGDPIVYESAAKFLRYRPRTVSIWLFWSFANELPAERRRAVSQTVDYHYDVDGYNFMYVNFYLADTDRTNGAHVLMAGTHHHKKLRHLLGSARLADDAAYAAYGKSAERVMEGPAGFGFLEDASCFHKALAPELGDRLMLQLRYQ